MQRRVLLTGGNGLLGQKIIPLLSNRTHVQLLVSSRGVNRHPQQGYEYASADLSHAEAVKEVFADFRPTDVIHTAAMTQVDACESDHDSCDASNVLAVKHLLDQCKVHDTRLIHISTDFVFDGEDGPYQEGDSPNPVNYYGESKRKAEELIEQSEVSHAILRTMLLYGISPAMSRSNIVLWVRKSLLEGKPIRVVDDQVRCPTLVEDLAAASVSALMKRAEGIYHISGAEMMNMLELAKKVAEFWNLDGNLISSTDSASLNQAAKRPPVTGFILLKAQTELDYQPHSLQEGLSLVDRQIRELSLSDH
ncbi:MAG: SDR family oxidoreductase [Bacteroidota bacterium]